MVQQLISPLQMSLISQKCITLSVSMVGISPRAHDVCQTVSTCLVLESLALKDHIESGHGALWILLTIFIKESSHVQLVPIQV